MKSPSTPERFRRQAVSPDEALERVLAQVKPLETETVPLAEAWRRRLAEAIAAPHPLPPFRRSAMDGYAVRAADLPAEGSTEVVALRVLESLPAGTVPRLAVRSGQASRIMTGGMMPEGADTVVMLEMTETEERGGDAFVRIRKHAPLGRNVAGIGSEVAAGERLFAAGRLVGAGETALLASLGFARVPVVRRPRVGVLATGSELLDADEPLAPGRIRNSNAPMLAALLRDAGAEPVLYGRTADQVSEVEALIRQGLAECDLLITTGGVSVGDSDVLVDTLAGWEGETLFNKVTMRPGSPTTAAVLGGKLLLALSGNPGACFVGFQLFAVPALRKMLRRGRPEHASFQARLAEAFPKVNAYSRYIRSRTEVREGTVWVRPAGDDFSSLMTTIAEADSLMLLPPLKEGLEWGTLVMVIPLVEGRGGS